MAVIDRTREGRAGTGVHAHRAAGGDCHHRDPELLICPVRSPEVIVRLMSSLIIILTVIGFWIDVILVQAVEQQQPVREEPVVNFNKDIAPIIFRHCSTCHRDGMAAPFNLLTYDDVRKRSRQISEVVQSKYMPPWLPEPGHGNFSGARRLTEGQIRLFQKWVDEGLDEGPENLRPNLPDWPTGWHSGKPDLVVQMNGEYTLQAEGRDVYRNFVLPVPTTKARYVRLLEFRPDNPEIVHHALIYVDSSRESRRRQNSSKNAGFNGMSVPSSASMPEGQFLGWQPGALYSHKTNTIPWLLEPGSDLVIQVHMNPSGKAEPFQFSIGLYFTDQPPVVTPYKIKLTSLAIDIPPNEQKFEVKDEFVLPGDVVVTRVLPHAHYLCRRMEGYAILPDGSEKPLLLIKNWDFNWQGDYHYQPSVFLPKGTKVMMNFTFDNTPNNTANPNSPPARVVYGSQSVDEMAELWFQLVLKNPDDRPLFDKMSREKAKANLLEFGRLSFSTETKKPDLLIMAAQARLTEEDYRGAYQLYSQVVRLEPKRVSAWFNMGILLMKTRQSKSAAVVFRRVISIDPNDPEAFGALGIVLYRQRKFEEAEEFLREALKLRPGDPVASTALESVLKAKNQKPNQP